MTSWQALAQLRVLTRDTSAGYPGTVVELTDPTMTVQASWGAQSAAGVFTQARAGSCSVAIFDPQRLLDPANASRPGRVEVGSELIVDVDTGAGPVTLWRGRLTDVRHDLGTAVTRLDAIDLVEQLAAVQLAETAVPAESTAARASRILDLAAWPADRRLITSTPTVQLQADTVAGSAWQALLDVAGWELGLVWVNTDGIVELRSRPEAWSATPPALTLGGTLRPVGVITSQLTLAEVVNSVALTRLGQTTPDVTQVADSIAHYGLRQLAYRDVPLVDAAASTTWSSDVLAWNDRPRPYLSAVRFPVLDVAAVDALAGLQLGDVWLIAESTPGLELTTAAWIVGVQHSITPDLWEATVLVVPPTTTGPRARWENSLAPWSSLPATAIPDYLYPLPTIGG